VAAIASLPSQFFFQKMTVVAVPALCYHCWFLANNFQNNKAPDGNATAIVVLLIATKLQEC
jgi:hypothetical protein